MHDPAFRPFLIKMSTPLALLCVAAFSLVIRGASGSELTFQSTPGRHNGLLELYTSEGCSSCPPAEAWLSRLTSSPQLWTSVVPIAFHVDYWDNLGWRDRFASPAATQRQRAYAAAWGSDSVYTPGIVLDGREWRNWAGVSPGDLPAVALGQEDAGQLRAVVRDGKSVTVTYRAASRPASSREVSVALLGGGLVSNVKAGENGGRSLRHDFVALAFESKKLSAGPVPTAAFDLPAPPQDVQTLALAVWVHESSRAAVEQATGGWLPKTR
jgi:hypothetical protein